MGYYRSFSEFHKIIAKRVEKLTGLMNYMKVLDSDLTNLISRKDRMKVFTNPQKKISKEHLDCLDNLEATNDKIQNVEKEMVLICSNSKGLTRIIEDIEGSSSKEHRNKEKFQETSALTSVSHPKNIFGLGTIGDSSAIHNEGSVSNLKYGDFHFNSYFLDIEHCIRLFTDPSKLSSLNSTKITSVPRSDAWHHETSSILEFFEKTEAYVGLNKSFTVGKELDGHTVGICFDNHYFCGSEFVYVVGITHYIMASAKSEEISLRHYITGTCTIARKDTSIDIPGGALLICSHGESHARVYLTKNCITVSTLYVNVSAGKNDIFLDSNEIYSHELVATLDGISDTRLHLVGNKMIGKEFNLKICGNGIADVVLSNNGIRGGKLRTIINGNGKTTFVVNNKNNIRDGKLYFVIDGEGDTDIIIDDNNMRGSEIYSKVDGHGFAKIIFDNKNDVRGGKLYFTIDGDGETDITIANNDIRGGKLSFTIDGDGFRKIILDNNDLRGCEIDIKIDGNGTSEVHLVLNVFSGGQLRVNICGAGDTKFVIENKDTRGDAVRMKIDGIGYGNVTFTNLCSAPAITG